MEGKKEDLYGSLCKHLALFWEEIRCTPYSHLVEKRADIMKQISVLKQISHEIGGSVAIDIAKLSSDVERYLQGRMSISEARRMVEEALKVEQETREL